MEPIGPPEIHYLSAATGWMELGNLAEAKAELKSLGPAFASHPGVLEVSWAIYAADNDWSQALAIAEQLVQNAGNHAVGWLHRAYAMRRAPEGGLQAAWDALVPAVDLFPTEATIPYNLSCYACQMGQLDEARRWLRRAAATGDRNKIKTMAASDFDLEPLWGEIKSL